ncbi:Crp/Fnr family transcriptional regulator [Mucilaginibacter sp. OK098]|uniref:Crp/Fnr family transcriptional regulator n=1 Tax=Mucilaginibacter sp. OK098 TaxID=1855297 RepID=UPI0009206179|nr:Crp/Fnr family transcriptional regulator [Mucilaginibacter sp. OK098]SHN10324.1 cAMP-binding domain of CRP or a regulatory subunit of cAMP-dependent protein kinases [Mucilaginibacter sp. OK098]
MTEELDEIKNVLLKLTGIAGKDLSVLDKLCTLKHYSKNDFFLRSGTTPVYSGFIVKGVFREYYTDNNGREFNKAFGFKGDFTGSYYDLALGNPSTASIQALTESSVLVIRYTEYQKLLATDSFWLKVAYTLAHNLLLKKFEKEFQLLTLSAAGRYNLLKKQHPDLEQLVPAYHIASYLGITPISLSRIRAQKKN